MIIYFYLINLDIYKKYKIICCDKTLKQNKNYQFKKNQIGFFILKRIARKFNRKLDLLFLYLIKYIYNKEKNGMINEID